MTESHKNPNKKKLPFSGTKKGSFFKSVQNTIYSDVFVWLYDAFKNAPEV